MIYDIPVYQYGIARHGVDTVTRIPLTHLEIDCERYLAEHRAVIADGDSDCLRRHRSRARYFLQAETRTLLVLEPDR